MFSSRWSAKFHSRQRSFGRLFRYLFYSMVKKITFLKGNLCMYIKEKLQNVPRFKMDFVSNFVMCSSDFTCF